MYFFFFFQVRASSYRLVQQTCPLKVGGVHKTPFTILYACLDLKMNVYFELGAVFS